jgi:hypothetical protein
MKRAKTQIEIIEEDIKRIHSKHQNQIKDKLLKMDNLLILFKIIIRINLKDNKKMSLI